jgi:hypothetical protein
MRKVVKDRRFQARFRPKWLLLPIAAALGACAPLSPTPPFHFAETAAVLRPGEVGVTAAGGVGGMGLGANGVGLGLRGRVGVGGDQEIGAEATVIHVSDGDMATPEMPWQGPSDSVAAKLSWKIAATRWLALEVGAGGSHAATGDAVGGDLALIASVPDPWGPFRPYLGVRGGLAMPVGRDTSEAGGITDGMTVGLGTMLAMSDSLDLVGEAGLVGAWSHGYHTTTADSAREAETQSDGGGYLVFGVALRFR